MFIFSICHPSIELNYFVRPSLCAHALPLVFIYIYLIASPRLKLFKISVLSFKNLIKICCGYLSSVVNINERFLKLFFRTCVSSINSIVHKSSVFYLCFNYGTKVRWCYAVYLHNLKIFIKIILINAAGPTFF
jgi:hypothetical protein